MKPTDCFIIENIICQFFMLPNNKGIIGNFYGGYFRMEGCKGSDTLLLPDGRTKP